MSEILTRLQGYTPPDRVQDDQRQIAQDIADAASEIAALRAALATAREDAKLAKAFHDVAVKERDLERYRNGKLTAALATANRWLTCEEHGMPDWRKPHCLFCELSKRATALDKAKAALVEIDKRAYECANDYCSHSECEVSRIAARALAELEGK